MITFTYLVYLIRHSKSLKKLAYSHMYYIYIYIYIASRVSEITLFSPLNTEAKVQRKAPAVYRISFV